LSDHAVFSDKARSSLNRRAFRWEWLTAAWLAIEAAVAFGSGIATHSLSLIAFGADSVIELVSAGLLLWRLTIEMHRGADFSEQIERRLAKIRRDPFVRSRGLRRCRRRLRVVGPRRTGILDTRIDPEHSRDPGHVVVSAQEGGGGRPTCEQGSPHGCD
jgi:hypothetical protein